jgi:hypothetical protein
VTDTFDGRSPRTMSLRQGWRVGGVYSWIKRDKPDSASLESKASRLAVSGTSIHTLQILFPGPFIIPYQYRA